MLQQHMQHHGLAACGHNRPVRVKVPHHSAPLTTTTFLSRHSSRISSSSSPDQPSTSGRTLREPFLFGRQQPESKTITTSIEEEINVEDMSSRIGWKKRMLGIGSMLLFSLPQAHPANASGGALSGGMLDLFRQFLGGVEGLGPWGPVVFLMVVMLCEMVPLFPTQPLSLASGLLFGAVNGALLMLLGVTLAAVNAFLIARGVGRPLAQKVIDWEMKSQADKEGASEEGGGMASKMSDVQRVIERGGLWQQIGAITLLRLTPVVPFSASNYLLGLTPVQMPAFLGGTLCGMAVWSVLYASLGGASRKLLDNGADIGSLLTDLGSKASAMSANIAGYSLIAVGLVVAAYLVRMFLQKINAASSMPLAGAESVSSTNNNWQQQQPGQSVAPASGESSLNGDVLPSTKRVPQQQQSQQQSQSRALSSHDEALQNK